MDNQRAGARPLVSVVIPTHNRREHVERAIRSVLTQTFRDFELVVVDDGSSDGTRESLSQFGPPLRYSWQPNRGVAAARNAGLKLARGDLVALLDSDDQWLPEHLAVTVALMQSHPAAVLASTTPGHRYGSMRRSHRASQVDPFPRILAEDFTGHPSSVLLRLAEVRAVGGFDERLDANEDVDLWLRLALRGPFVLLARSTTVISQTADSRSGGVRENGTKLRATTVSLRTLTEDLEGVGNAVGAAQVRGALGFLEALQLLDSGTDDGIAERLAAACEALPMLSQAWGYGLYRFSLLPSARDPCERLRKLQALASAWPDRSSPMATVWHAYAALMALRTGHLRAAARLSGDVQVRRLGQLVWEWTIRRSFASALGWDQSSASVRRAVRVPGC